MMGATNMIRHTIYLDAAAGGIVPELHLKKGESSAELKFLVARDEGLSDAAFKRAVFLARLPDGTEFFATGYTAWEDHRISAAMYSANVRALARAAGTFRLTMTILDTKSQASRKNYLDYGMLTVLPVNVTVHGKT